MVPLVSLMVQEQKTKVRVLHKTCKIDNWFHSIFTGAELQGQQLE